MIHKREKTNIILLDTLITKTSFNQKQKILI